MPRRILHLDSGREWRGGQRQLLLLADGQRAAGLEPLVVTPPHTALLSRCRDHGIAVAAVRMRSHLDLLAVRRLHQLIRQWRPDLIHAHDARSLAIASVARLLHREIPLIVTRRSTAAPGRVRQYAKSATRVIAISDAVAAALHEAGVPPDRIRRVYPGVRPPVVAAARDWRTETGWAADDVIAGVIRAGSDIALITLADAVERLLPEDRSRLRLITFGGTMVGTERLNDVPLFRVGHVHDMPAAIAGLDLLVQPVAGDGLGTPIVEALALRVPVVVGRTGSLGEIVDDGVDGLLVPPGDPVALAQALSRLLHDEEFRRRLGSAGPARAAQFDVSRFVAGVEAVYDDARRTARAWRGRSQ